MARHWRKIFADGGPDVLTDPEELLVTFFIPLPDFMRIPDNTIMATYRPIDSSTIHWLERVCSITTKRLCRLELPKFGESGECSATSRVYGLSSIRSGCCTSFGVAAYG